MAIQLEFRNLGLYPENAVQGKDVTLLDGEGRIAKRVMLHWDVDTYPHWPIDERAMVILLPGETGVVEITYEVLLEGKGFKLRFLDSEIPLGL